MSNQTPTHRPGQPYPLPGRAIVANPGLNAALDGLLLDRRTNTYGEPNDQKIDFLSKLVPTPHPAREPLDKIQALFHTGRTPTEKRRAPDESALTTHTAEVKAALAREPVAVWCIENLWQLNSFQKERGLHTSRHEPSGRNIRARVTLGAFHNSSTEPRHTERSVIFYDAPDAHTLTPVAAVNLASLYAWITA